MFRLQTFCGYIPTSFCVLPASKTYFSDPNGRKCMVKFSIKNSQNYFLIVANTAVELEEILKLKKSKNNPIQPCLLIVGTVVNASQILVLKYTFSDKFQIFNAFDTRMRNTTYFFLNGNNHFFLHIRIEYFFLNNFCIKSFFLNTKLAYEI